MKAVQASPEFMAWVKEHIGSLMPKTREIVARGEQHVPAMFVWPKNIDLGIQIIPMDAFFGDSDGKNVVGMLHREVASDPQVDVAVVVTESWVLATSMPKEEADLKKMMRAGIEHHPERKEAIVFNCINNQGMQLIVSYHIKRPENTLSEQPDVVMDPVTGVIEGPFKTKPGEFSGAYGRMVVPPEKH